MSGRDLSEELAALEAMNRDQLRRAWVKRVRTTPPNLSAGLLRLALGHAMQSKALSGITKSMDRKLRDLISGHCGPAPGTRYSRSWQGKLHIVTVTEDSKFSWQGKEWNSLSEVARAITGTRWSGPRFFGGNARAL